MRQFAGFAEAYVYINQVKNSWVWKSAKDVDAQFPGVKSRHPLQVLVAGAISLEYGATRLMIVDDGIVDAAGYMEILNQIYLPWHRSVLSAGGASSVSR